MNIDLSTSYLGMTLRTPLIASASPLSDDLGTVRQMEDAGISAIVIRSWFTDHAGGRSGLGNLDAYAGHLRNAKKAAGVPVIASLSGTTGCDWRAPARRMQDAGADALELNVYYVPLDLDMPGDRVEGDHVETLAAVREAITIPVAVKMSPFFTNVCNVAKRFSECGADGLVLFNRFYQPDLEIETRRVTSHVLLSTEHDLRLALRWIALLHGRVDADLAATGGIRTGHDVVKMLAVGADATMLCSALIEGGVERIRAIEEEVRVWMEACEFPSVAALKGCMSHRSVLDPAAFERAQYVAAIGGGLPGERQ